MIIDVSALRGKASFESEKVCSVRGTNGITKPFEYAFPRCIAPLKRTPDFFITVCKRKGSILWRRFFTII